VAGGFCHQRPDISDNCGTTSEEHYQPSWSTSIELLSDRGTTFLSKVMTEMYKLFGIKKLNTTANHCQTDGFVKNSTDRSLTCWRSEYIIQGEIGTSSFCMCCSSIGTVYKYQHRRVYSICCMAGILVYLRMKCLLPQMTDELLMCVIIRQNAIIVLLKPGSWLKVKFKNLRNSIMITKLLSRRYV